MGKAGLTHEEIWDDSALQQSWDDALAEYKKYHSLAAKGEQIDLSQLENSEKQTPVPKAPLIDQSQELANGTSHATVQPSTQITGGAEASQSAPAASTTIPAASVTAQSTGNIVPQALLQSVQDESLENLMMSWYYAGYYTGLLEGQQKAYSSMQGGG